MNFISYFFYLAGNWNVTIAFHIILNEIKGEKKYGIHTSGADDLLHLENKGIDITHATVYMPVSYDILEHFFKKINVSSCKHFLDIGCGKGRVMCVAAISGATKVTGIDFSPDLIKAARRNIENIQKEGGKVNYTLVNNDAFYFDIPIDTDCIFMFNPFDEVIMSSVLKNIDKSLLQYPRNITVIYINPVQKHLFLNSGYKETYHYQKLHYLEGSVFEKT